MFRAGSIRKGRFTMRKHISACSVLHINSRLGLAGSLDKGDGILVMTTYGKIHGSRDGYKHKHTQQSTRVNRIKYTHQLINERSKLSSF